MIFFHEKKIDKKRPLLQVKASKHAKIISAFFKDQ